MLYIIAGVCILIIVGLRATAPKRYAVHASRATPLPRGVKSSSSYPFAGFLRDEDGNRLDASGKFFGQAVRDSMTAFGIPDGATFVADYLNDTGRHALDRGTIVVVQGGHVNSRTGLRLRAIDHVEGETAYFLPDGRGQNRRQRPLEEVYAKVTHVVNPEAAPPGMLLSFLRRTVLPAESVV
jgi:hypothetical protein